MSSSTGTAGEPKWVTGDAPSLYATFNELSEFALKRGGLLRGTTAERNAFAAAGYAREGDHWYDTTSDQLFKSDGNAWQVENLKSGSFLSIASGLTVTRQRMELRGDFIHMSFACTGSFTNNMFIGYITTADYRPFATEIYPVSISATSPIAGNMRIRGRADASNQGEMWLWGGTGTALHVNLTYRWR